VGHVHLWLQARSKVKTLSAQLEERKKQLVASDESTRRAAEDGAAATKQLREREKTLQVC